MNLAIFLDADAVAGDADLLVAAKDHLYQLMSDSSAYLARFASAVNSFAEDRSWWTRLPGVGGRAAAQIDLKKLGIFPIVQGARALALQYRVAELRTVQRLRVLTDAGWIEPVPDELAARIKADTLGGPYQTAVWKTDDDEAKRLYAIPTWTNTQLLWYRPDVLQQFLNKDTPPVTWDEMLADNEIIRRAGGPSYIMVQGKQYEGLMVWFNSVLSSAGGQVVDPNDPNKQTLNDTPEHRAATVKALQTLKAVATAPGADPSITNSDESSARLGMESGKATFEVNWPFVFPSMRSNAGAGDVAFLPEVKQEFGPLFADPDNPPPDNELAPVNDLVRSKFDFARYPGVLPEVPSKVTLGGVNIAVADTSEQKDLAFKAAECMTNEQSQKLYSISGGTPPTLAAIYDDPDFQAAYPMGQQIKTQLESENAALRPASPVYQAISTLLVAKLSPVGAWDPETLVDQLADQVDKAIKGEGLIP